MIRISASCPAAGNSSSTRQGLFADESPPDKLRVAGIVLKWIRGDREANYARLGPLVRSAAAGGADIVCTTECFLDGYSIEDKSISLEEFRSLGEPIPGGRYYEKLQKLADELDIHLIVGILEQRWRSSLQYRDSPQS